MNSFPRSFLLSPNLQEIQQSLSVFRLTVFENQQLFLAKFCRKKSVPRQKLRRYQAYLKKSILQLPAALGRAKAKLPEFIEISDCLTRLYANKRNNLV